MRGGKDLTAIVVACRISSPPRVERRMDPRELEREERAEALLMRARPRASDDFVAATETSLVGRPQRARRVRRPAFLAAALASVLAVGFVAASLVARLPGRPSDDALATNPCAPVKTVSTSGAGGALVLKDGRPTVVTAPPVRQIDQTPCR